MRVGVGHAEAEDGVVLWDAVVGEGRLFGLVEVHRIGEGKGMVRGWRVVDVWGRGALGLDRGGRGRGGREWGLWVRNTEAVSVRVKGHLGVRERKRER